MEFEKAKEIISNITYKPGYYFYLTKDSKFSSDYFIFKIRATIPDSNGLSNPNSQHFVMMDSLINGEIENELELLKFVKYCIHNFECHEIKEWLRYKGDHLDDPHPEFIDCVKYVDNS